MKGLNYYHYNSCNKSMLFDLAKFVVEENYKHHDVFSIRKSKDEIQEIYDEESAFDNSKIFVTKDYFDSVIGSIRVMKWNRSNILPIEKLFNVNLNEIIPNENCEIWHIGRFAIKKGVDTKSFNVFKSLMAHAINEVCKTENSVAVAECDSKLLRILNLLGLETTVLADPIFYLGSETIPVLFTHNSLKRFLEGNNHLLFENFATLHESVVLQQSA